MSNVSSSGASGASGVGGAGSGANVPRAIVAGHGDFAAGLVSAVEQITGRGGQLIAISVRDLTVADIEQLLRDRMVESKCA